MTSRAGASETVKARAISTICRRPIDRSCTRSPAPTPWPGKISSSLSRMRRPARLRQPKPRIERMKHPRVFGDRQIRAERQFLEHAAQAERLGAGGRIAALLLAGDRRAARVRRHAAVQDMHQCRLAGAVVADDADAFALRQTKNRRRPEPGRRRRIFRRREVDESSAARAMSLSAPARDAASPGAYFMLALMAAIASACVYSWLATPPFGIFGSSASKSSWVKAR